MIAKQKRKMTSRSDRKLWQASEKRVAEKLGHAQVKGSGNGVRQSDNYGPEKRGEHKFTEKGYFRVTIQLLRKIKNEALMSARSPIFTVDMKRYGMFQLEPYYNGGELSESECVTWKVYQQSFQLAGEILKASEHPIIIDFQEYKEKWLLSKM